MEITEKEFDLPQPYKEKKKNWTAVLGSDCHCTTGEQTNFGKKYTWVKMEEPNIEGLKLALLDNYPISVTPHYSNESPPPGIPPLFIKQIEIDKAKYCGQNEPLTSQFHPYLNTFIGGRGTGKSTIIEFMRIVMRRENELRGSLKKTFDEFNNVPLKRNDKGALTKETTVKLHYIKNGQEFILQWDNEGKKTSVQLIKDGIPTPEERDIPKSFPIKIFSQNSRKKNWKTTGKVPKKLKTCSKKRKTTFVHWIFPSNTSMETTKSGPRYWKLRSSSAKKPNVSNNI